MAADLHAARSLRSSASAGIAPATAKNTAKNNAAVALITPHPSLEQSVSGYVEREGPRAYCTGGPVGYRKVPPAYSKV
jgi:hypothetical protein